MPLGIRPRRQRPLGASVPDDVKAASLGDPRCHRSYCGPPGTSSAGYRHTELVHHAALVILAMVQGEDSAIVATEASVERRLAAILAGDVVGYSRLMGVDEVGTLSAL